jgi:hypothetical protein
MDQMMTRPENNSHNMYNTLAKNNHFYIENKTYEKRKLKN